MTKTKVLIIDDEQEFASTLRERLALRDYDAQAVFFPEHIQDSLASSRPDIVLLDLGIGGGQSLEILRKIREYRADCSVIVVTGVADKRVFEEAKAAGAADVLVKPIDITVLTERIKHALERNNRHHDRWNIDRGGSRFE